MAVIRNDKKFILMTDLGLCKDMILFRDTCHGEGDLGNICIL